jgi:DNA segregation ATPase FtsK/SpoIIIE-like protein
MISLGDVFRQKSSFLLDANNTMPLIWGIGEMGNVFCYDGMKDGNGGIIISGEARSGKSWKGQSLIAQMCMFRSPKDLELYFYDVKGDASDYAYLSRVLPHCKGFCGDSLRFNDSISSLLERECKRRTDLLAGKYTNVKDYNKDNPFNKIPTIYIVIDEMATAMSEMKDRDIEIRTKFDSLLIQIATKYPYLEIKLMLFPHRIVNDIINKTVSSMISTRSVLGNVPAEELKSALDIRKDFPYSLVKTGDMAIKTKSLNNGNAVYSHSEVLSTDESTNRKIFDYIGAVWKKLEPDCKILEESKRSYSSTNRVAKDNSVFNEDFSYQPATDVFQDMPSGDDYLDDVDESFWDEELGNNTDSDSSFWSNWNNK